MLASIFGKHSASILRLEDGGHVRKVCSLIKKNLQLEKCVGSCGSKYGDHSFVGYSAM
jgi:hypothetical protein